MSHNAQVRRIRKILVDMGMPQFARMTTHSGRRSAATSLIAAGYDSTLAMQITGHRSIRTFQEYVTSNQPTLRNAMSTIGEDILGMQID